MYDSISKTVLIPYPINKFVKTPRQIFLFLQFFKDFQSSKSCMIRYEIMFPDICFEKFINFELSSQIYIKTKELDYLLKNQPFPIDYIQKVTDEKNNLTKKIAEMQLFLNFSFFCFFYRNYFLFLQQTTFVHSFLRLLLCIHVLIWKI